MAENAPTISPSPSNDAYNTPPKPSTSTRKSLASDTSKTPPTLRQPRLPKSPTASVEDDNAWGSNFWVTLVDPQSQTSFFACPATGEVSWDAPVGNFVMPPNADGEWWELIDESRGGIPYYYQTKTGETVWERPEGFVIPLGILQNTALGRRLSNRLSLSVSDDLLARTGSGRHLLYRRSKSFNQDGAPSPDDGRKQGTPRQNGAKYTNLSPNSAMRQMPARRSFTNDYSGSSRVHTLGQYLPPIPASDNSAPPSPSPSHRPITPSGHSNKSAKSRTELKSSGSTKSSHSQAPSGGSPTRSRAKSSSYVSRKSPQPQSLHAALELLSTSDSGHGSSLSSPNQSPTSSRHRPITPTKNGQNATPDKKKPPPVPTRRPQTPSELKIRNISAPAGIHGKEISSPVMNNAATANLSPVKKRAEGRPIPVEPKLVTNGTSTIAQLSTSTLPTLPTDLVSDIQQFSESDYAKRYFSTHRTGLIFRRPVPMAQMMAWQKAPLTSPLLTLQDRSLNKEAVKIFKVIQHLMGDREGDRSTRVQPDTHVSILPSINGSSTSLPSISSAFLDEERWLLGAGITHGELRDEIYCQVMKQLTGNANPESVFKGWQLLSVLLITFPPSKNFETYLQQFMQKHTSQQEGRVDVMAKYGLRRLSYISKKGPRGKPPTLAEIETASDAAFNPSTFGESLDAIIRLQERNYPRQKVPIILPFLADGILALGGTKSEGIFRVPGDGDSVSELKVRIDRGYYNLDGVDDPHILASLMKLWLRELLDPLVPEEMYNECIMNSQDPDACVRIVTRLPTINRRVVLFVISFLQLFLEERTQTVTKMTPANLALVMAPNLLRCSSDSMAVVFTNAQYEQYFVYHLLLHLKCADVDPDYVPLHGLGAVASVPSPARPAKSRPRRH